MVLLQDAAFLIDLFPGLEIFKGEVFQSESFINFRESLLAISNNESISADHKISTFSVIVSEELVNLQEKHDALMSLMQSRFDKVDRSGISIQEQINFSRLVLEDVRIISSFRLPNSSEEESIVQPNPAEIATDPPFLSDKRITNDLENCRMSRGLTTVSEVWQEWHYGLVNGLPSIIFLEAHRKGWRRGDGTHFSRRQFIVRLVNDVAQKMVNMAGLHISA